MTNRNGSSDSNELSNGSSTCCIETPSSSEPLMTPEISALQQLSSSLQSIIESPDFDFFADATIVVSSREVPIHRCILSARSQFLRNAFVGKEKGAKFELKELVKDFDVGFDSLAAVLGYMYCGKLRPLPKEVSNCVDEECPHLACRPAVDFMVKVLYLSYTFQVPELVALFQRRLLDILNKVAADDILVILSVANMCGKECERLLARCIELVVKSDVDLATIDKELPYEIVKQIVDLRVELGSDVPERTSFPDKHVKRIHRALDSDDVELVRMLLKEGHTNLDDAHALHYAVAFCDSKTTRELLDLALADVNNRNSRGYTVLHVAARRKDPQIIVSLLTKGARLSDLTPDGRKALQIAKRTTRAADYYKSTEEGKPAPKERLCIEVLEQAERRNPLLGEASHSLALEGDGLRMKLLYLENRVGLIKLLFPMEAQVVMDIARVDSTSEFPLANMNPMNLTGAQRSAVDLNEAPFRIKEEQLKRLGALSRTVELGKRYFPRCSEVVNKIMDADDLSQLACLGGETPEERQIKKQRYMELQEVLIKAFTEDKKEHSMSVITSSSSFKVASRTRSDDDDANKSNLAAKVKEGIGSVIHRVMGDYNRKASNSAAKVKEDIEAMIHQAFADGKANEPNLVAKIKEGIESIIHHDNTPIIIRKLMEGAMTLPKILRSMKLRLQMRLKELKRNLKPLFKQFNMRTKN